MDNINIKYHPPWYARGTPVINIRDGPAMANHDKLLFAICRGPSGEGRDQGKGGGGSQQLAVGSWQSEDGRWKSEDRSRNPDSFQGEVARLPARQHQYGGNGISRGKPKGKTRRWLTLKTTFFNTQNRVYSQWYGVLGRKLGVVDADRCGDAVRSEERTTVDFDLSACVAPDNVKMEMVDELVDADRTCPDISRSGEADVGFDLSACVAPDNVKMKKNNVKTMMMDNNVRKGK